MRRLVPFRNVLGRYPWQLALLAVLFGLLAPLYLKLARDGIAFLRGGGPRIEAPFEVHPVTLEVTRAREETQVAGLRLGDRVLAINGVRCTRHQIVLWVFRAASPGEILRVEVLSALSAPRDAPVRRTITVRPVAGKPATAGELALVVVLGVILPVFSLLLAFGVVALRPGDGRAWLVLAVVLSYAQVMAGGLDIGEWLSAWYTPGLVMRALVTSVWPLWMFLLGLYFPDRLELDRRHPFLKLAIVVPLALLGLLRVATGLAPAGRGSVALALESIHRALGRWPLVLVLVAIGLFFACAGYRAFSARSPDARRRLRLLYAGANVALGPMLVVVLISLVRSTPLHEAVPFWILAAVLLLSALFPFTLAYVIVVHRALDLRVVLRQGLQYALARNAILGGQVLATAAAIILAALMARDPSATRPRNIVVLGVSMAVIFFSRRLAGRLSRWLDRKFFREAYQAEQILSDLQERVRTMVETQPLLETVTSRIAESLYAVPVVAMVRSNGLYQRAYAVGLDEQEGPAFGAGSALIARLREEKQPLPVDCDDPGSWVNQGNQYQEDLPNIRRMRSQLLLPLASREELLGFLSLGPKRSEEPYSSRDMQLLLSVAYQTGLSLENSRLAAAHASEVARRERFKRDVEIAREVQERLFPQSYPRLEGLDLAGKCRPAQGIGCDYYDFFDLPGGRLGVVIADIAGKGIPAALLMAHLQASLRGQAIGGATNLVALMVNLNRLVYEASPANRYATVFLATYDPADRSVTYVNGGHNAPVILRPDGNRFEVIHLRDGGPPVGLLPIAPFQQGHVVLRAGDLLVGFTDGISEAMNHQSEEWGEERMIAALERCYALGAAEVIERLIAEADAFVAGAPQHDDMTAIVVRVLL